VRPSSRRTPATFSLFSKEDKAPSEDKGTPSLRVASLSFLPASTAPPRLEAQLEEGQKKHLEEQQQGRGKRRRVGTAGYREAREQGLMGSLGHSQTQHYA
jgi:hypothetical protein